MSRIIIIDGVDISKLSEDELDQKRGEKQEEIKNLSMSVSTVEIELMELKKNICNLRNTRNELEKKKLDLEQIVKRGKTALGNLRVTEKQYEAQYWNVKNGRV